MHSLWLAPALRQLGRIQHLNDGTFTNFVGACPIVLFGKEFKQGFVVFKFTEFGDVVAFATACSGNGRLCVFGTGELSTQRGELNLCLFEVGC